MLCTLSHRRLSVAAPRISVALASLLALFAAPTCAAAQEVIEYYGRDAIGSIRAVFDATGAVVARHDFGPFGEQIGDSSPIPKERYAGLFRDGEAGLDYAEARSYQARTGRFNAPDSVYPDPLDPQRWNRYTYVSNHPFDGIDPSGQTEVGVNCGVGPQWCPGSIQIGPDKWINVDNQFNPATYGYQGGEPSAMLNAWGQLRDAEFLALAGFGQPGGISTPTIGYCPYYVFPCGEVTNHYQDGQYKPEKRDYDPNRENVSPWEFFPNHTRVVGVDAALFGDNLYKIGDAVHATIFGDGSMKFDFQVMTFAHPFTDVTHNININEVFDTAGKWYTGHEGTSIQEYHAFIKKNPNFTDPHHRHIRR